MGFAKIDDGAMTALAGASGGTVLMYIAVARQSHFDDKWTCAQLDEYAQLAPRTGRKARTDLMRRGLIQKEGCHWATTGPIVPPQPAQTCRLTEINRPKRAGDTGPNVPVDDGIPAQTCRSDRPNRAGAPYIEKSERTDQSWHEGSAPISGTRTRRKWNDVPEGERIRVGKMMARIKGAMEEHGNPRMAFDDLLRWALLEHGDDATVEDIIRRIRAGRLDRADHPFAVIASQLKQWAMELPGSAPETPAVSDSDIAYLRRMVARWTSPDYDDAHNLIAIRERCADILDTLGLTDYGSVVQYLNGDET